MENLKQNIKDLQKYVESLLEIWQNPHYVTVSVMLQNLYTTDDLSEEFCNKILKSISLLNDYLKKQDHVIKFVSEHLHMDIHGHFMSGFIHESEKENKKEFNEGEWIKFNLNIYLNNESRTKVKFKESPIKITNIIASTIIGYSPVTVIDEFNEERTFSHDGHYYQDKSESMFDLLMLVDDLPF